MNALTEKIDRLDLSLFESIPSQTSEGDRRSLLAVQRATSQRHAEFSYLEIGSHLGGSLQPYVLDDRCKTIYSIDPRPSHQPDDRSPGFVAYYQDNSSERMLSMLDDVGDTSKIECLDLDASDIDPRVITCKPQVIFIDGEHTKAAVLSDFQFCSKVVGDDGAILFHDFHYIYPAILQICDDLSRQGRRHVAVKLEGAVFAIFFDPELVSADSYLSSHHRDTRTFWIKFQAREWLKRALPSPLMRLIRGFRNGLGTHTPSGGAVAGQCRPTC